MDNEPKTPFTDEELKLICRALNTYNRILSIPTLMQEDRNDAEKAHELSSRIYRENFRI